MTGSATRRPETAAEVLEAVAALAPAVAERAAEVEDARRVPPDLLEAVVATGAFRMLLPRSYGGLEVTLTDAMQVVEALSRADASVGWTAMIGSSSWHDLLGLPRETLDDLYANGPDVRIAGVFSPSGVAVPVDGGYRVRGRWAFASGCQDAAWLYGNCLEEADRGMRLALMASSDVKVEDTWHVAGLNGTGSHHFQVDDLLVPADHTYAIADGQPALDLVIARVPSPSLFSLQIAAVALGTARGALDETVAAATARVPLFSGGTLAASPTFHVQLATADTVLRAARALLYESAEETWAVAAQGSELTLEQRARVRAAATWAATSCADVVTTAYRAGGGRALYLESPLQRRLRDISALTQHFLVRADTMATAGGVLVGQELTVPFL